jgi:2-C-methyl-D-erythritol 4-phosphate cytidylyltransferase
MSPVDTPQAPVWAIVPAAGSGSRIGVQTPKQYLPLAGQPMLWHTLHALAPTPRLAGMVIVTTAEDRQWRRCVPPGIEIHHAHGGEARMHSVLNGLRVLASFVPDHAWVLVHDAARPCVPREDLERLVAAVEGHPCGGLLARPVADTLKRQHAARPPVVESTVSRAGLWQALTPQLFRLGLLRDALERADVQNIVVTDESQAIERLGHQPLLVEGSAVNFKVTLPADLALAERLLAGGGALA